MRTHTGHIPKMSKERAGYVADASGEERCGTCSMFRMLDRCTAVEGHVSPDGWCRLYEAVLDKAPFAASE